MSRADSALRGRVVFLVGARRSGTRWLERILDAHPDVAVVPSETFLFSHGLRPLSDRVWHGIVPAVTVGRIYMQRDAYVDGLRELCDRLFGDLLTALDPRATVIVERTPWHVYHLDLVAAIYPEAPVVHVLRDGRDVVRSLLAQPWGPDNAELAATEWRTAVEAAREWGPRLEHFAEVRYEELLAAPRAGAARLYESVGLRCDDAILDAALDAAAVATSVDVGTPWVAAAKWRGNLSSEDLATFDRVAGAVSAAAGYPPAEVADGGPPPRRSASRSLGAIKKAAAGRRHRTRTRAVHEHLHDDAVALATVEEVLSLLAVGAVSDAAPRMDDGVSLRVVSGDVRWHRLGVAHLDEFVAAVRAAEGGASQLRSRAFVDRGTVTVLRRHAGPDGDELDEVVVGAVHHDDGTRLTSLAVYARDLLADHW